MKKTEILKWYVSYFLYSLPAISIPWSCVKLVYSAFKSTFIIFLTMICSEDQVSRGIQSNKIEPKIKINNIYSAQISYIKCSNAHYKIKNGIKKAKN